RLPSDAGAQVLLIGHVGGDLEGVQAIKDGVTYGVRGPLILSQLPDSALATLVRDGRVAVTVGSGVNRIRVHGQLTQLEGFNSRPRGAQFVSSPAGLRASTLDQLARDLVMTVLLAFLAFGLGVWVLSLRVLSPLKRVTDSASQVSGADLSLRVPVPDTRD